jgi:hypothetical protein
VVLSRVNIVELPKKIPYYLFVGAKVMLSIEVFQLWPAVQEVTHSCF